MLSGVVRIFSCVRYHLDMGQNTFIMRLQVTPDLTFLATDISKAVTNRGFEVLRADDFVTNHNGTFPTLCVIRFTSLDDARGFLEELNHHQNASLAFREVKAETVGEDPWTREHYGISRDLPAAE